MSCRHSTPIAAALAAAKRYLPPGLANWTRHAPNAATAPLYGFDGLYSASSGSKFVALAIVMEQPIVLRARRDMSIDVRSTSTGQLVKHLNVSSGEAVTLTWRRARCIDRRGPREMTGSRKQRVDGARNPSQVLSESRPLHIAALASIAIAQPLFDLLGQAPEFLLAHDLGPSEILAVVVTLGAGLPLAVRSS